MSTGAGMPAKPGVKKLSHRHRRVLDLMVRNPELRGSEVAEMVGLSHAWVSTIINSDLFQEELAKRREAFEMQDNKAISAKLNKALHLGLDKLIDHIDTPVFDPTDDDTVIDDFDEGPSFQEIKQTTELMLKASGYLGKAAAPATSVTVNQQTVHNHVAPSTLERARAKLIGEGDASEDSTKNLPTP